MLKRLFPFIAWPFTAQTLRHDAIAGATVALVAIPQSLAYAQLAGCPPYFGLYAALIPSVIGVLFGSSGVLSTGPVAMTSLLTAASIAPLAAHGSEQFYSFAILLALLSGVFQLAFGVMRLGVLLNFLSHPVLMGFINAAAIIISLSQLPALLGIPSTQSKHLLLDTWHVIANLDSLHELSLAFGMVALLMMLGFRRYAPKLPGVLITVALATALSQAIGYEQMGGRIVGDIPQGLPQFSLPPTDWGATTALLPAAFVIALISFMEAMSSCKIISIRTRTPWDENQELIGQGLAKIAAAFSHAMPVSGSFSRSALNLASNARTGMSSIIAAGFVLVTLLFFTPLLHALPKPVLAAIIMLAVIGLFNMRAFVDAWRARRDDGIAAAITFAATLIFAPNIQNGIVTGIILSLALLLYRLMRPRVAIVGLHEDGALRDAALHGLPPLHPRLGAIRFDGALFFVSVEYFEEALLELASARSDLRYILVVGGGINALDASGVEMLSTLTERLRANGVVLAFSGLKRQVLSVMESTGLDRKIGADNLFATDAIAIECIIERLGPA